MFMFMIFFPCMCVCLCVCVRVCVCACVRAVQYVRACVCDPFNEWYGNIWTKYYYSILHLSILFNIYHTPRATSDFAVYLIRKHFITKVIISSRYLDRKLQE